MNITMTRSIRGRAARALAIGTLAAVPLLALAGPAQATTNVSVSGGKLLVNAGNVGDTIRISRLGSTITVNNAADTLSTGGVCANVNANTVNCPAAVITSLQVNTQGGDDFVTNAAGLPLRGFMGAGNDSYTGGTGRDIVNGDLGDDILRGGGGDNDIVSGDAGFDQGSGGSGTGDICETEFRSSTCEG
ncbi:calcium-binding protein [Nonomuraea sp. LPB2021202275-12-8]|uniref:calcium-binding protein n=1 Tax=Nonomuraea sp. LPB2021202275-12-8 TaxID=3120159 RepID=UPI00300C06DE